MDRGEREVIAVALGIGAGEATAVIDDRRGVRCAERLGIRVIGTLTVLAQLHRRGHARRAFEEDLGVLDDAGMYMSAELKRRVLESFRAGEGDNP